MRVRRVIVGAAAAVALGVIPAGVAAASTHSAPSTTIKFIATTTSQTSTKTGFQESGKDTHNGKLLGYFELSCQFTSSSEASCGGAGSFATGMLYFQFTSSESSSTFAGKVTGGTGAYKGATGKISGKEINQKKESVTIVLS